MFWLGYVLLILAVLLALFSLWQNKLPPKAVIEMAKGIVDGNPADLAAAKGIDLETYSLARVGQSEEGLSSDRAKIAVMYATVNHAKRQGKTITELVTRGNPGRTDYEAANGHYGRQGIHPYCSTIAEPTQYTISLAAQVLAGTVPDETEGAQFWDNPHTQDALAALNPRRLVNPEAPEDEQVWTGYYTSAEIAQRRESKGLKQVNIDGVSTRFWK